MAFNYDLTTDRGEVRLNIGDTVENAGPRPDKRNFTDAEVDHFIATDTASNVAASAFGFEILASEWTAYSITEREGEVSFDAKEVAKNYLTIANEWRKKPDGGISGGSLKAGVIIQDFMEKGDDTSS